jgi:hypothetical protein
MERRRYLEEELMPSKAEDFRHNKERSGPKKAKLAARPHRKVSEIERALLSESATERHVGEGFLNRRNRSKSTARKFHARRRAGRTF